MRLLTAALSIAAFASAGAQASLTPHQRLAREVYPS